MSKLGYFTFTLILLFVGLSFFVIFSEPHNFKDIQQSTDFESSEWDNFDLDDPIAVENYILNLQDSVTSTATSYKKNGKINEQQYVEINELIGRSSSEYRDFRADKSRPLGEETEKALYFSLWHINKARALTIYYDTQNCVTSSLDVVNKFKNFFFFLNKEDRDTAIELKKDLNGLGKRIKGLDDYPDDVRGAKMDVQSFLNSQRNFQETERQCGKFEPTILADYKYQKFFFKVKVFLAIIFTVIVFILGKIITIANIKRLWKFFIPGQKNFWDKVLGAIFPKNVKKETIKSILKLSSLATVIVAVGGLIVSVMGLKNWTLAFMIVICAISLLSSILFGVMSINSGSKNQRRASYFLFIVGLILFIILILELVIVINLASLTMTVKDSLVALLSNSTII